MTACVDTLGKALAAQDAKLMELAERQAKLLKQIAEIKPVVNLPPRPREFTVLLAKDEDGETMGMRIAAKALN